MSDPETPNVSTVPETPPSEGQQSNTGLSSVQQLVVEQIAKTGVETNIKELSKGQNFFSIVMIGIVIVLFIGFAAMLFAVIPIIFNWWEISSSNQRDLRESIIQLKGSVDELKLQISTPTPTPSVQKASPSSTPTF